jgi:hypothetical protein
MKRRLRSSRITLRFAELRPLQGNQ